MFKRILIANRGEIACRIARTCTRLGVEFVAVHSTADIDALHLRGAVATVCLGNGPAAESYLRGSKIIAAALENGCDAIHPGYGFLSENAEFAAAVREAGLEFIGPRADTIAELGDKARAKSLMAAAGVPTVPGFDEASDDPDRVASMIQATGLPVLLKPSAGGGGKGMQVISSFDGMHQAAAAAIRVARNNFGDGRLIVERYIERPRHIEVQVFGDSNGNVVHLYERECSLQRRHQKVVEEAPAATLPQAVRERLLDAAVRGARSIGYLNAGTFEFILGPDQEFYFLEVNTRLQVEHPVTEAITSLDLVEWQLLVASGESLPLKQQQIHAVGHAIECRVYAEDPADGFKPMPGTVSYVSWPRSIRVEAGIASGGEVPPYYDPMIAKLVVHAENRGSAMVEMRSALRETCLLGLTTNLGFLDRILGDSGVRENKDVHTRYLDEHADTLNRPQDYRLAAASAAAAVLPDRARRAAWPWSGGHFAGMLDRKWLGANCSLGAVRFWLNDRVVSANLSSVRYAEAMYDSREPTFMHLSVNVDGSDHLVDAIMIARGVKHGEVSGQRWFAAELQSGVEVQVAGDRISFEALRSRVADEGGGGGKAVAPMPGMVAAVLVTPGDRVEVGAVLAIVEAMKMENSVLAQVEGLVKAVRFSAGDTVKAGDLLVEIEPSTQVCP
ncbi:Methylcrotonyl-CoA carboxylase biotin-containing subunit (plasmid) [Cupriavidus sp. U2]|uniref:acetyl/propionyl/methylcrotonyl-CoA carboxylase subunit alpha n=1 Tax=Cupriavidus sp. U2 TaxID=2920269 RepID=UPI00129D5E3B|nr:biotin carboxylase N-terminal domain-containing protein [Cupriavidus sp. U2]KAI3590334.1 Methylcrotonyl-CoA carboxylase biotin-containing subunit [Cupriavidus sp. U2]